MLKFLSSPLVRLSFGLVMLTVAILLVVDLLGFIPDTTKPELQARKVIAESVAVQMSSSVSAENLLAAEPMLRSVVNRNANVLSAAVRDRENAVAFQVGDHVANWTLTPEARSTPTEVQVPLYDREGRWGTVEIRFAPLVKTGTSFDPRNSFVTFVVFMAISGFIAYLIFLKRALRELNPDAVIPDRVRRALDALAEGLLIIDQREYIVFSNASFARKTGLASEDLVGRSIGGLDWEFGEEDSEPPWKMILHGEEIPSDYTLRMKTRFDAVYKFSVKATPIQSDGTAIRGALITFDDITELEAKNDHLRRTLQKLEKSQQEIKRQNRELHLLATRDPLTGALNRRSFFQGFEALFAEAKDSGEPLCCIMVDIDHFKSVNDTYGHGVGDIVIKFLANLLTECSRPTDLVGRFGGEEFCVVLPGVEVDVAARVAERMRQGVKQGDGKEFDVGLKITASFGVSSLLNRPPTHKELLEQADEALYVAKETGRNRVVCHEPDMRAKAELLPPGQEPAGAVEAPPPVKAAAVQKVPEKVPAPLAPEPAVASVQPDNQMVGQHEEPDKSIINGDSTGRMLLLDRIEQSIRRARRSRHEVAVLVVSLDAMEQLAHTMGSAAAEKFSRAVTERLRDRLRTTDTISLPEHIGDSGFSISRLGAEELVILLTDVQSTDNITDIMQRLFLREEEPVEVDGSEVFPTTSVGVSVFPRDGDNVEALLNHASSAMREARQMSGRNNFQFYAEDIQKQSKRRLRVETELHRAVKRDELVLHYQPKVDLSTGEIRSMEALVRWDHPELGLVPPGEFIPLAEQTGIIEEISKWVLRRVCGQMRFWRESGFPEVSIAVNLSPVEFRNPNLAREFLQTLEEFALSPRALEVEVTETVAMQHLEAAQTILRELADAGVAISMDDFGTGYSSLSYLKSFPLHKLKIDRAFIMDVTEGPDGAAIVSAIMAMSHSLGLWVIAEGVETEEQLRFLQDLRCDEVQGYYLSKPLPREQAGDLLREHTSIRQIVMAHGNGLGMGGEQGMENLMPGMIGVLNDAPNR